MSYLTSTSNHPENQQALLEMVSLILRAKVYDVAKETPLDHAPHLSKKYQNHIYLKREDLQPVFSFKLRGAYNKIAHLLQSMPKDDLKGIICASAGNHAQGVALSAAKLGIMAHIVMPVTTPDVKIDAVKYFGGDYVTIVLHGNSYSDAYVHALGLQDELNLQFIHPFDDPYVIAGQGTVAMEILKQFQLKQTQQELDAIFVAIGGGGLIAGVVSYIKAIAPHIKVIGVQANDSNAMQQSIAQNKRIALTDVGLFSDGTAVKQVGYLTFDIAKQWVDEIITVSTDELCTSIKAIYDETRTVVEPAGAMALAGLIAYQQKYACKNQHWVAINCGANMNFNRLHFVAERANIAEHKEALFAVEIPEQAGSLKQLCNILDAHHITEFNYRYTPNKAKAAIFLGVQVKNQTDWQTLHQTLNHQNFNCIHLSDDELATMHIRHMIGGANHSNTQEDEQVFEFNFPEKPKALIEFLNAMPNDWNISLFHYRNHGADYAKVLVGLQVPKTQTHLLQNFLQHLDYAYVDVSAHKAYQLFLG